jgi:GT2 family glycosyltransferase
MDVSTILVNYNTKEMTLDCINSIYDKTNGVEFEVIVVDNNSSDGSKEVLSDDKRITFVEAGDNLGFGKANNLG